MYLDIIKASNMAEKNPTTHLISLVSFILLMMIFPVKAQNSTIPVKIGVILNLETWVGKMGLSCINMALSDFYDSNPKYKTRLLLNTRDAHEDVVVAAASGLDLIKNVEVQAIIGPQTPMQASFVIELGEKAHVPIVSFLAASPSLTSLRSSYFFRAAQNDTSQVKAISAIVEAFGWREVAPIYVDNAYGEGIIPYLTDALQEVNAHVCYRSAIPPSATDDQIEAYLYKLMTMQARVFVVHMFPTLASRLFKKAQEIGMMEKGYVWIMTRDITEQLSSLNDSIIDDMQGVLGIKTHVPKTKPLESFKVRWRRQFEQDNRNVTNEGLSVFGIWAYDATFALAMAVEKVWSSTTKSGFDESNSSKNSSTDLQTIGISQSGPKLREELSRTRFSGLAGEFNLVDGQLLSSAFQIVNINGERERLIGFWTPQNGLTKKLHSGLKESAYSTSKSILRSIIWPGDSTSVPKGWVDPTNAKKLRILVPVKSNVSAFIRIARDNSTNATIVSGFSVEVFRAVIDAMPYAVPYEFVPFANSSGKINGSYNDMLYQVYLGNYDAVVGDVAIVANRSNYVDFTLPYTESGVSMIAPIRVMKTKNAWVFLKPLTFGLWVTTGCFFIFIGIVVWILEHRINEDFRGPPSHQIGTSLWFSFSTMVFAHREKVVSNLARFVVIIWCFVVLILTQSYTASLTSLLTVQHLRPTITDPKELLENGAIIGFPKGSFVLQMMKETIDFKSYQIKEFQNLQNLEELFLSGEINAAYDEIPYLKYFIAKHCSKYAMVGPIYKTNGFGFAFSKGSSIVGDVSRTILNVTESDKMEAIENAWFTPQSSCQESSIGSNSDRLGLNSFWGLFVIVGTTSVAALLMFAIMFLHQHREILTHFDTEDSIWHRIRIMLRIFDEKDLSSHTFRKTIEQQNRSIHGIDAVSASPNTHCPPSPSSYSGQTESNFSFHEEPGNPTPNGQSSPEP
ncbi:hypothetical protein UlMin_035820 [Ulmus minor]